MDSPEAIYDELKTLEAAIEGSGKNIKSLATDAANKRAVYEDKKNNALIEMFAEESKQNFKRTEKQRESIYRTMFSTDRLMWQLADNELAAERDYLKAVLGNLTSVQTRLKIVQIDLDISRSGRTI